MNLNKPIIPLLMEKTDWPPKGSMGPIFSEYLFIRFFQRGDEATEAKDKRYWPVPKFQELLMQLNYFVVPDQKMVQKGKKTLYRCHTCTFDAILSDLFLIFYIFRHEHNLCVVSKHCHLTMYVTFSLCFFLSVLMWFRLLLPSVLNKSTLFSEYKNWWIPIVEDIEIDKNKKKQASSKPQQQSKPQVSLRQ